jgi:uncharacterized membrane protein
MKKQLVILSAAAAVITGGALSLTSKEATADNHNEKEKCYGVVKAGKNDCGSAGHSCAGQAKADNAKDEWVFTPKGLCDKLANGSTEAPSKDHDHM